MSRIERIIDKFFVPLMIVGFMAGLSASHILHTRATAAPRIAPQDAEIVGEFDWAGSAPTVYVPRDDGTKGRVWLVFASDDREATAKAFQDKDRVRVTGKVGQGGEYRYFVVSKIERAE